VDQMTNINSGQTSLYNSQIRAELLQGDWDGIFKSSTEWLEAEPGQPVATFFQNMACLFVNPPSMIRNKRYLSAVKDKDWKVVLGWFGEFQPESDRHNPYFQALNFIIVPQSKKKAAIETAIQEHPNNAELLFFQALAMRDHNRSIEKLSHALEDKPEFAAAQYMIGIYSLELNQVQEAEIHLKKAVEIAPDFLEAHYQLGNLYSLYIPDAQEQAKVHLEKVVELDPEGEAGKDAQKVLEKNTPPQYGQRIASASGRRGGMSLFTILGITLFAIWLFAFPLSSMFKVKNPLVVGVTAGLFVFIGLYSVSNRKR
jgi:tetratricopeptide (TPR) repeat protein